MGIAIKAVLYETLANTYLQHYKIHHISKKSKYKICDIDYRRDVFFVQESLKRDNKEIDVIKKM